MEPSDAAILVILVNHQFETLTDSFMVKMTSADYILDLKVKVKERFHDNDDVPQLNSTSLLKLAVWETMGTKLINASTTDSRIHEILSDIDVNNKDTIQKLFEWQRFADIGLSNNQTLLIQLPGVSRIFISLAVSSYMSSWRSA